MSIEFGDVTSFKNALNGITKEEKKRELSEKCLKSLATNFLNIVIPLTPVGVYPSGSGRVGGTLRRGWTCITHEEAENGKERSVSSKVSKIPCVRKGNQTIMTITNPVEYAMFVEYGHMCQNGTAVVGRLMKTIAEQKLKSNAENIVKSTVNKWLNDNVRT